MRRLILKIGGCRHGVSDIALQRLRLRLTDGLDSTLGGCHFVRSRKLKKKASFLVVREIGRFPKKYDVSAGDDMIFAGCWRVQTNQAGKLVDACSLKEKLLIGTSTLMPPLIAKLPYLVRRTIPTLCALDGSVIYPQVIGVDKNPGSKKSLLQSKFLFSRF